MTNDRIPAAAFAKLLTLSDAAEYYSSRVIKTEEGIAAARMRLSGNFTKDQDFDDLRASLDQMIKDLPVLKKRCADAEAIYKKCREFVDTLPEGATLESVEATAAGDNRCREQARRLALRRARRSRSPRWARLVNNVREFERCPFHRSGMKHTLRAAAVARVCPTFCQIMGRAPGLAVCPCYSFQNTAQPAVGRTLPTRGKGRPLGKGGHRWPTASVSPSAVGLLILRAPSRAARGRRCDV
jgi:hypothetical protein